MLAVGTYPRSQELGWASFVLGYPIQVHIEKSPAKAYGLVEENFYPVISFNDTDTIGISGSQFLKNCQKISPLSSRILYSSSLQENKLQALVKTGQITSYAMSPFEVGSALSANIIAFESYKINLLGSRLFNLDFESIAGLDGTLNELSQISVDIGLRKGLEALKVDFDNRDLELNRLLLGAKAIEQTIACAKTHSQSLLAESNKTGKAGEADKKISLIQDCLNNLTTYLTRSEIFLMKSTHHVVETNSKLASTLEKIKKMKEDWLYDLS